MHVCEKVIQFSFHPFVSLEGSTFDDTKSVRSQKFEEIRVKRVNNNVTYIESVCLSAGVWVCLSVCLALGPSVSLYLLMPSM